MNQYRFPENKWTKAIFGLFLFAVLYLARDTLVTSSILGFYKAQFLMLGLFFLAGVAFLLMNRKRLKQILLDPRMAVIAMCFLAVLLPMTLKGDWQMMYFIILICMLCGVFLAFVLPHREVAKYYVVILTALAAYSVLAAYGLRRLPDQGMLSVPVFYNQAGVDFYNFVFSFVSVGYLNTRNFGIFREPGVYQFFLILGLYLAHYKVTWKKEYWMWIVTVILSVTMLTTLATGGIIELGLLALVVFFDKKLYRNKWLCAAVLVLMGFAAVVLAVSYQQKNALYWELYANLIGKFTQRTDSVTERVEALGVNLRMFFSNPLLGAELSSVLHAVAHNTISTLVLFAFFGLGCGILNVGALLALVWEREQKVWVNLALLAILFLSFNTQNLTADVFFWLFPMMALAERFAAGWKRPSKEVQT